MKYIISYNESNKFLNLKNLIEDIKDICIDIYDIPEQNYKISIYPDNDIKIKILSIELFNIEKSPDFYLILSNRQHNEEGYITINDVSETIQRIIDFMLLNGFISKLSCYKGNGSFSKDFNSVGELESFRGIIKISFSRN